MLSHFLLLWWWLFFRCPLPPVAQASSTAVSEAVALLANAQRPLVIIGKGAAYNHAEDQVRNFIHRSGLPFLPTPMGMIKFLICIG